MADKAFRGRYGKLDWGTLRRMLPQARKQLAEAIVEYRGDLQREQGKSWTPAQEKFAEAVIESIVNYDRKYEFCGTLVFDFSTDDEKRILAKLSGN